MMSTFSALLEARDPALGRFRSYRLSAGIDLLGVWIIEVNYGRIGTTGRWLRYVADNEAEARRLVHHCLQRRSTAKKRIGVPYRFRELIDPCQWLFLMSDEVNSTKTIAEQDAAKPPNQESGERVHLYGRNRAHGTE